MKQEPNTVVPNLTVNTVPVNAVNIRTVDKQAPDASWEMMHDGKYIRPIEMLDHGTVLY